MLAILNKIASSGIISSLLVKLGAKAEANKGKTNFTTFLMAAVASYFGVDAAQVADVLRTLADYISAVPVK